MKTQIFLASPKGFCAGVERAINTVERAINTVENIQKTGHGDIHDNIYVYHEIVHNSYIIENFKKQGIKFINHLSELPDNAKSIVFSAHGVSREIMKAAEKKNLRIIDATCPLVDLVHRRIKSLSEKGYTILLIGHIGHDEVIGSMGWFSPNNDKSGQNITIIDSIETAKSVELENSEKLAWVSQTTLSVDDTNEIVKILKERFSNLESPKNSFICYATQNRQAAVKELIKSVNSMIIIGSKNSSNTNRLYEIAAQKVPTYQIDNASQLTKNMISGKTGISAGASVPDILVKEIIEKIKKMVTVTNVIEQKGVKEELKFKPVQL